ncbi:MAG TPA: transposase [Tepidisphaeraceae bacterium]
MPNYRRAYRPGGTFFFTLVTYRRRPLFDASANVGRLRAAVAEERKARPFDLLAAVILPDHLHWMIRLPVGDADFSSRIGRIKAAFTKSLGAGESDAGPRNAPSRVRHRERNVWQRRFSEHVIRDDDDFRAHVDYVHYNPVKHGHARCPHAWAASSFGKWVRGDFYPEDWHCVCEGRTPEPPNFDPLGHPGVDDDTP